MFVFSGYRPHGRTGDPRTQILPRLRLEQVHRLRELANFQSGGAPSKVRPSLQTNRDVPVRIEDIFVIFLYRKLVPLKRF